MSHVDQEHIQADFLSNNLELLAEHRNAHFYECQECHEWFDEDTDISQGWCKECRESERQDTTQGNHYRLPSILRDEDDLKRQFREGHANTIKPPSKNV